MPGESSEADDKWLAWAIKRLNSMAPNDHTVDYDLFQKALLIEDNFFSARFFQCCAGPGHGVVGVEALSRAMEQLTHGEMGDKLRFLFEVYDVDGNGSIEPNELKTVLQSCMEDGSLRLSEEALDTMTMLLFEKADVNGNGRITFEELRGELNKYPDILENLTISAANCLCASTTSKSGKQEPTPIIACSPGCGVQQHAARVIVILVYGVINVVLFTLSAVRHRHSNGYVMAARGCGMCLNFNCAVVVLPVLRKCITRMRTSKLAKYLPLDENIRFHKLIGCTIVLQSVVHTGAHLANLMVVAKKTRPAFTYWEFLFTLHPGIGWIDGFACLSGVVLIAILAVIALLSLPCVRRNGYFQVFFWSHLLYTIFWLFCFLHAPIFWMFFLVPGTVFLCECIHRTGVFTLIKYEPMHIIEVNLLPSKVTHLVIERPDNFHFRSGDYIYVKIAQIAQHEWHPFTISSAPELQGSISLHIRSAGDWTNHLYEYFYNYKVETGTLNGSVRDIVSVSTADDERRRSISRTRYFHLDRAADNTNIDQSTIRSTKYSIASFENQSKIVRIPISIDGPYGTSCRWIFDMEHAVLIACGIGVTPYASILQSIMCRYMTIKRTCPQCEHSWFAEIPGDLISVRKVDFIWVNHDQRCFEWFVSLLTSLEMMQSEEGPLSRFLDMQMFVTGALSSNQLKGVGLQMALELMHSTNRRDAITGLRTRTQYGRPDWQLIFKKLSEEETRKVRVFVCGPPALAKTLRGYCDTYGFKFSEEIFAN